MILELKIGLACGEITCVTSGKNVEICFQCLYLITLEVWKCGNVEMWKYVFLVLIYLITLEVWKCGNLEICLPCLHLVTMEMWKCGNVEICLQRLYLITLEVWKCGNVEVCVQCLCLITLEVWKCGKWTPLTVAGLAFKKSDWRPSKHEDVLH